MAESFSQQAWHWHVSKFWKWWRFCLIVDDIASCTCFGLVTYQWSHSMSSWAWACTLARQINLRSLLLANRWQLRGTQKPAVLHLFSAQLQAPQLHPQRGLAKLHKLLRSFESVQKTFSDHVPKWTPSWPAPSQWSAGLWWNKNTDGDSAQQYQTFCWANLALEIAPPTWESHRSIVQISGWSWGHPVTFPQILYIVCTQAWVLLWRKWSWAFHDSMFDG